MADLSIAPYFGLDEPKFRLTSDRDDDLESYGVLSKIKRHSVGYFTLFVSPYTTLGMPKLKISKPRSRGGPTRSLLHNELQSHTRSIEEERAMNVDDTRS